MSFANVSKAVLATYEPLPSPNIQCTRLLTFARVNHRATEGFPQFLSLLHPIPPPLTAAMADIPPQSAAQAVLLLCMIRFHRRVPTPSKHSHACPHSTLALRSSLTYGIIFSRKGFGRGSSQLMRIARGVSLYTNCVSDRAS